MSFIIEAAIISLAVCIFAFLCILLMIPVSHQLGLLDKPSGRKVHAGDVPLIGGIAIYIAIFLACSLFVPLTFEYKIYLISSALMVFIGAIDDRYDISVRVRLVGQVIVASLLVFGVGVYIETLGNILHFWSLDLGLVGIPFTMICVLAAINAFNMIDGIDGLLGSLSINTFLSIAILFGMSGGTELLILPLILASALVPYLVFNLKKTSNKKIFMGDAGSMFIGLSVIWLLSFGTQKSNQLILPVTALWIIAVPLMDMMAIVFRRIRKGQSPFKPDRDHLHHIFMRLGFSDRQALVFITLVSITFSAIGIMGQILQVPESVSFLAFIVVFIFYNRCLTHSWIILKWLRRKEC